MHRPAQSRFRTTNSGRFIHIAWRDAKDRQFIPLPTPGDARFPNNHDLAGEHLSNFLERCSPSGAPQKGEIAVQRNSVEFAALQEGQQGLDLAGKGKAFRASTEIKGFDAQSISRQKQFLPAAIPNRKGENTIEL